VSAPFCSGARLIARMGLRNAWNRSLVYFGIVEEDEYWDDEAYEAEQELERTYTDRPNVRRLHSSRQRDASFDDWTDPGPERDKQPEPTRTQPGPARTPSSRGRRANLEAVPSAGSKVHLIVPRSFNDAQTIADRFKNAVPVILNLQGADTELSKRLIDFSSGLTYALDGGMQRVADKVFLLTPHDVEVSAEERARLVERGFFNQA
jgi:cell division inhibitor SepF